MCGLGGCVLWRRRLTIKLGVFRRVNTSILPILLANTGHTNDADFSNHTNYSDDADNSNDIAG